MIDKSVICLAVSTICNILLQGATGCACAYTVSQQQAVEMAHIVVPISSTQFEAKEECSKGGKLKSSATNSRPAK